jgi:LIVCS family branched-chain amino acid:cation transporter
MLFDADRQKFLAPMGKHLSFIFVLIVMMLTGPCGVMARIVNVAFGGFSNLLPHLKPWIFNITYIFIMLIIAYNPDKVISIIGKIFTPLKLGGLIIIIIGTIYFGSTEHIAENFVTAPFFKGFNMGYQTMDLMASIICPQSIYFYLKNSLPKEEQNDKKKLLNLTGYSCIIGAFLLAIVYIGLVLASVKYSAQLQGVVNENLLGKIAELAMGAGTSWFISIVVAVSCLATVTMLCCSFTDYIHRDLCKQKFNRAIIMIIVGIAAFIASLIGFDKVCSILGMVLEKIYPIFIIFVIFRILLYYAAKATKKQ